MEAGKMNPLDLNYNKLFSGKDKNREFTVVPATQTPSSSSSSSSQVFSFREMCKTLSEYEIKERISRTKTIIASIARSLPDKGAKLKENLKTLEEEHEKRRLFHEIEIIYKEFQENSVGTMVWKKHKILDSGNVYVGEDKISNLPDELIHHILSFLPTKCAMSTCILSKRWKLLANSMPILDFRNWRSDASKDKVLETKCFINFLDTIFYLHEKPNIQKFYLERDYLLDESQVYKWISIVIKRKVKEIFLSGIFRTSFTLPLSFFTCDSLTVLDLDSVRPNVPNTVFFPRLKLLRLTRINFDDGISTNKLLSNCPILEEISLILCYLKSNDFNIENFALKKLHIESCIFKETTMKICAPNLMTFSYGGELPADFVFDRFPSLAEGDVDIVYNYRDFSAKTLVLIKLFGALSSVKILKISGHSILGLSHVDIFLPDFPEFSNLIHLEVSSEFDCDSVGSDPVSTLRILFRFLQLSPNLETVVFAKKIYGRRGKESEDRWSVEPKCSLPHLKSVKFSCFNGMREELDAIKLLLKCDVVLETLTIITSPPLSRDYEAQTKVMRQLLTFPKPINCVINFF